MKIDPEDITPELLCAALHELTAEDSSVNSRALAEVIVKLVKEDLLVHDSVNEILLHVTENIPSCYEDGLCFHQARCIFTLGLNVAINLCNAREDAERLGRMYEGT